MSSDNPLNLQSSALMQGSVNSALDSRSLNDLKNQSKAQRGSKAFDESIDKAAVQFESVFLQWALKSMRETVPDGGIFSDSTSKQYQAMYDQQLVQQLSGKGLGLAAEIARQLRKQSGVEDKTPEAEHALKQSTSLNSTHSFEQPALTLEKTGR